MARSKRSERARARAMAAFVAGLERGEHVTAAARAAGRHGSTFYAWRRSVAGFAEAWDAAVEESARPVLIAAANGRALQKRRTRRVRFTRGRKETFLARFAATCNAAASAEAAGVCVDTVWKHLQSDPAFAEGYEAALGMGHQILRAEMVARQRAAQETYRIAPDPESVAAAASDDFERNLKLLDSWQRREAGVARRAAKSGDAHTRWFDVEPPIEEVRADILRKIEAMERHEREQEARRAPEEPPFAP